jgi:hypothetical protein
VNWNTWPNRPPLEDRVRAWLCFMESAMRGHSISTATTRAAAKSWAFSLIVIGTCLAARLTAVANFLASGSFKRQCGSPRRSAMIPW